MRRYEMCEYGMQGCYCPDFYGTQEFMTVNLLQQTGTTTGLVNLGNTVFYSGKAITFTSPNAINLNAPGIYKVYFALDATISTLDDDITIQPLLGDSQIVGSGVTLSPDKVGTAFAVANEFYVSTNCPAVLTFMQTSTNTTDIINDFTVTVIRL